MEDYGALSESHFANPKEQHARSWKDWESKARKGQQCFYKFGGSRMYDVYKDGDNQITLIATKVAFALYGYPKKKNVNSIFDGYTRCQKEKSQEVARTIRQMSSYRNVRMRTIFVYCKDGSKTFIEPVFGVASERGDSYIDGNNRVYGSWNDYLENNQLPACEYCYPMNGYYSCRRDRYSYKNGKDVRACLCFGRTPACLRDVFDTLAVIGGAISVGIRIAGVLTLLATILAFIRDAIGGRCARHAFTRSTFALIDRAYHDQTRGWLKDEEAFPEWLDVADYMLQEACLSQANAADCLAVQKCTLSARARFLITAMNVASLTVRRARLAFGLYFLIEKAEQETLEEEDVVDFSTSSFFFFHTLIQPATVKEIIRRAEQFGSTDYCEQLIMKRAQISNKLRESIRKEEVNEDPILGIWEVKNGYELFPEKPSWWGLKTGPFNIFAMEIEGFIICWPDGVPLEYNEKLDGYMADTELIQQIRRQAKKLRFEFINEFDFVSHVRKQSQQHGIRADIKKLQLPHSGVTMWLR